MWTYVQKVSPLTPIWALGDVQPSQQLHRRSACNRPRSLLTNLTSGRRCGDEHHAVEIDGKRIEPELARINFLDRTLTASRVIDPPIELDAYSAILGVILGPLAEVNFRRALMTEDDLTLFVTRPISLTFLILSVLSLLYPFYQTYKHKKRLMKSQQDVMKG